MKRAVLASVALVGALALTGPGAEMGVGGGGFLAGLLRLDLAPLNGELSSAGYPTLSGDLWVFGGGGSGGATTGLVFGALGFSGSASALAQAKRADLELGFGGITVEFARSLSDKALVGLGVVLGGGGLDLTVRARIATEFAEALTQPTMSQFSLGFLGGLAYLRLHLQVLDWLSLEGWVGYFLGLPGNWEEGGREISGPNIELRAPFFGVRIGLGGFGPIEEETP